MVWLSSIPLYSQQYCTNFFFPLRERASGQEGEPGCGGGGQREREGLLNRLHAQAAARPRLNLTT